MTDLGIYGEQVFFVSSIEKDRQLSGFTSDTLNALRTRFPGVVFDLIVGGDQAAVFDTWHEPQEILSLSRLLVGARPGFPLKIPGSLDHSRIETVAIEMLDLSSSDIRRLVKSGIAESDLSAMVPAPVAEYIVRHRLYRP
jgi:nicotinate-nucleotide adenylyltransferase